MPRMDEIKHTETGQTLVVYTVDADEFVASGDWERIRSDLPVQPSIKQRPGGVLAQSEIKKLSPPDNVTDIAASKGTRK